MQRILAIFIGFMFLLSPVAAGARTPAPGSKERVIILNALRPSIEAQLGANIEFIVQALDVAEGWAFVQAMPQRRGGYKIDWRGYFAASEWEHMDGLTVTAILQYRYGRWNLVEKAIGATDAWYCATKAASIAQFCR